jgi:hypothetical protein
MVQSPPEVSTSEEPEWLQAEFLAPPPMEEDSVARQVTSSSSLARNEVVRENTTEMAGNGTTHFEEVKKYALSNPVVSEVQRLFKAEIKDIQPK